MIACSLDRPGSAIPCKCVVPVSRSIPPKQRVKVHTTLGVEMVLVQENGFEVAGQGAQPAGPKRQVSADLMARSSCRSP